MKTHNSQPTTYNRKPLVSVIMPVYNAGAFLVEAIESILNQTYRNFELIIIDDASTDNSHEIAHEFALEYSRKIKLYTISKQTNAAGNGAMNKGFVHAKGDFIARMDADDIADPTRLAKQVNYLLKHPKTIVLGTQAYVIDKNGQIVGKKTMPTTHTQIYQEYGVFHPIVHPSVMINRKLLPHKDRIYEMHFDVNDDYYTFFKLLNFGKFANLPEYLLSYRVHGKNFSLNHPKAKFLDSIRIRWIAVSRLNYQISLRSLLLMLVQMAILIPIPERFIVPLYLLARGIKKPGEIVEDFIFSSFSRIQPLEKHNIVKI